jgi:hypothetical protein
MSKLYLNGRLCNGSGVLENEFKVPELRKIAEEYKIPGAKKLNKEPLCKAIIAYEESQKALTVVPPVVRKNSVVAPVQPKVETAPVIVRKNSAVVPIPPKVETAPVIVRKNSAVQPTEPKVETPPVIVRENSLVQPTEPKVETAPVIVRKNSAVQPLVSSQLVRTNSVLEPVGNMNINGTTISSISGPVSFYYFRPTNKFSKLPLIMLFGDYHKSQENVSNSSMEKKSGCYNISDPELLKLFDTLGSEDYPVDFYTETSFIGTGTTFDGEMKKLTTGDMLSCYHHRLRDTKYDKCPTRNIRWHAGNIIQASDKYGSKYIDSKNSNNTLSEYKNTSTHYKNNGYIESELEVIFSMIKNGEALTEKHFENTSFGTFEKFKNFIYSGLLMYNQRAMFEYALTRFGSYFFQENSAINKQIQKQSLVQLKNLDVWSKLYGLSLNKIFKEFTESEIMLMQTEIETSTLENINEESKKKIWRIMSAITWPLSDIYVLARMLKKPTYGNVSSLSIAYFGNAHIKNMVYLLESLDKILNMKDGSKYELVTSLDFDRSKKSRCLTMPDINLTDEVNKHNSTIQPVQPVTLSFMSINGNNISSISGPISFYYFRPTNKLSKLPLIVLFGDKHRDRDNMCTKCACSRTTKSCCYKLSDRPLLQLFDTLGSEDYPVDFYTETSFGGTGKGFENGEMEILTTGDMTSCYHHRLRDTKYNKCPTKNIRWHAGDIRQASSRYFNTFIDNLNSSNTELAYKETSKYFKENMYVESQMSFIISFMSQGFVPYYVINAINMSEFGSFENFKNFIMLLFEPNDMVYSISSLRTFSSALFSMKNSAINKQIQKQSLDELKNKEIWIDLYAASLKDRFDEISIYRIMNIKEQIQSTTLENIDEERKKSAWEEISYIKHPLLDLYVLARMFKQPTDGNISSISFGYFGDAHIRNMVKILSSLDKILDTKDSKYELVNRIDARYNNVNRCLTMPAINLTDEVNKHNSTIKPVSYMNINGNNIKSISGPISFYYLSPTIRLSKLPLIVLFGDSHRDSADMCTKCDCSKGAKSCCYKLSDPILLKLFDTLGSSKYPVDFYTETSFLGTNKTFADGEMKSLTTGDMISCYHHRLRDTNHNKCPTRNIRWQAADILKGSEDYYRVFVEDYNRVAIKNSKNTLAKLEEYKKTSKYFKLDRSMFFKQHMYVETQISYILDTIIINNWHHSEHTEFDSFKNFKKFIMPLFEKKDISSLQKFASGLFSMKNSAINKQIKKQLLPELKNREVWAKLYAMSIRKNMDDLDIYSDKHFLKIKTDIESITEENTYEETKKDIWRLIKSIIIPPLLDIYVLARMFKKPTDGNVSSISFGYFGDAHIKNMVYLLRSLPTVLSYTDSSQYDVSVARIDDYKVSKCLTLPPIDLTDEVNKHNAGI